MHLLHAVSEEAGKEHGDAGGHGIAGKQSYRVVRCYVGVGIESGRTSSTFNL